MKWWQSGVTASYNCARDLPEAFAERPMRSEAVHEAVRVAELARGRRDRVVN